MPPAHIGRFPGRRPDTSSPPPPPPPSAEPRAPLVLVAACVGAGLVVLLLAAMRGGDAAGAGASAGVGVGVGAGGGAGALGIEPRAHELAAAGNSACDLRVAAAVAAERASLADEREALRRSREELAGAQADVARDHTELAAERARAPAPAATASPKPLAPPAQSPIANPTPAEVPPAELSPAPAPEPLASGGGATARAARLAELLSRIADDEQRRAWRVLNYTFMAPRSRVPGHERMGDWPIPNDPPSTAVDPSRFIVSGRGLGADVGAGRVLAGHRLLPAAVAQALPSEAELTSCAVGEPCTFAVQAHDAAGAPVAHDDADFFARLYGDSIVDVPVARVGGGRYEASFVPREAGSFVVEVYLSWLEGGGTGPELAYTRLPYLVEDVVFRGANILVVADAAATGTPGAAASPPLPARAPACTSADPGPGRWRHMAGGACAQPYCTGEVSLREAQVSDPIGLLQDLVWAPWTCRYHIYSPRELAGCFSGCGLRRFSFAGDSIAREHFQNFVLMLTGFSPKDISLPRTRSEVPNEVPLDVGGYSISASYGSGPPGAGSDVLFFNLGEAHRTARALPLGAEEEADIKMTLARAAQSTCPDQQRCFYLLPPSQITEKNYLVDRTSPGGRGQFGMAATNRRMQRYDAWAREFQAENPELAKRLLFVDGLSPTRAPWLSSWDGMHYSVIGLNLPCRDGSAWYGGASMMMTQSFLNGLCNRECNPEYARIRDL